MEVRAVFKLPVHVWVTREALGETHPSGFGHLRFNILMPTAVRRPMADGRWPMADGRWIADYGPASRLRRRVPCRVERRLR